MRNLKKLLAVIVSVCVLATFALPAFAAELTAAEIVEDLGVLKGDSSEGVTDTYLAKGTSRMQAAILTLRLIGKEDEAYAFEGEDNFTDADQTWDNAQKALAYLKANPELGWQGVSADKFDPKAPISAQQMYKVCLEALGYKQGTDFEWADVFTFAEGKGLKLIADVTDMTNGDVATALVEVLKLTLKDSKTTLIADLVAKGVVTEADAIATGLIEATPDELEVASVTSTNLIQAVVTFNQKVDNDTATDVDNYDFATADKIKVIDAALSEDGVSVVLTFDDTAMAKQQQKAKLTVSGVKTAAGAAMKKSTTEVSFLDNTIPEILSAEVVGISSIKVTFSEPMDDTTVKNTSFKVNDGKYYVKGITSQKNDTEFIVELYTSLKDGDLPFEVKVGPADYAGFTAMGLTTTLTVVEDKEAPTVVSFKDAKPNSVVLIWNEDIVLADTAAKNYYHTNSSNPVKAPLVQKDDIDGNEMTLRFTDANKMPNGTAYVYVLKDAVKDLWNNKNAQQMTAIDVVVDKDAPVLQSIDFKAQNKIVLVFDEDLKATTATKRANYTLLDKDGEEKKNAVKSATLDGKKVTIIFNSDLDGGDYTIVVKNIEDIAGNEMASTSMGFTVTDSNAPVDSDFSAKLYFVGEGAAIDQIIKISFGEAMAVGGTYGIDDLSKYVFAAGVDKVIEDIDDVSIAVVDDGKAVEITIPKAKRLVSVGEVVKIARVADAQGNYTVKLENSVTIDPSGFIAIEKAELTGEKEVKVYFGDELSKFEADEVLFTAANGFAADTEISSVGTELKDGKTVATYSLTKAVNYNARVDELDNTSTKLKVTTKANPGVPADDHITSNSYGELLVYSASVDVADKLAPKLAQTKDDNGEDDVDDVTVSMVRTGAGTSVSAYVYTSTITLTFKEDLDANYLNYGSFEVSGFDISSVALDGTDKNKVIIVVVDDEIFVEENVAITLSSPIKDAAGNALDELETDVKISLDERNADTKAGLVANALTVAKDATTLPIVAGYTVTVKSTSDATVYDSTGKGLKVGTSNVIYTLTHDASQKTADTASVTVTVTP